MSEGSDRLASLATANMLTVAKCSLDQIKLILAEHEDNHGVAKISVVAMHFFEKTAKYVEAVTTNQVIQRLQTENDNEKASKVLKNTLDRLRQKHTECEKLREEMSRYRAHTNEQMSEKIKNDSMKLKLKSLKEEVTLYKGFYEELQGLRRSAQKHGKEVNDLAIELEKQTAEVSSLKKALRRSEVKHERFRLTTETDLALESRRGEIESQRLMQEVDTFRCQMDRLREDKQKMQDDLMSENHQLNVELQHIRTHLNEALTKSQDAHRMLPQTHVSSSHHNYRSMLSFLFPNEIDTRRQRLHASSRYTNDTIEEPECMICLDQQPTLKLYPCQDKAICRECAISCIEKF